MKRGMGVCGGKPQGRLSLFVFPLPSTGQTVTRKTGKSERRRRRRRKRGCERPRWKISKF